MPTKVQILTPTFLIVKMKERMLYAMAGAALLLVGMRTCQVCQENKGDEEVLEVKGNSMFPAIHDGDKVRIEKGYDLESKIEKRDIVVFHLPGPNARVDPYAKRVLYLPGEEAPNGKILGDHEWWVEGDSKATSKDSRYFGPIQGIEARVIEVYCPHKKENQQP